MADIFNGLYILALVTVLVVFGISYFLGKGELEDLIWMLFASLALQHHAL